jgi:hypothetical protein
MHIPDPPGFFWKNVIDGAGPGCDPGSTYAGARGRMTRPRAMGYYWRSPNFSIRLR